MVRGLIPATIRARIHDWLVLMIERWFKRYGLSMQSRWLIRMAIDTPVGGTVGGATDRTA